MENEPKTRFEPFIDDLTAEEILAQTQEAAATVKRKISERKKASRMGFLRQQKDGTTSMQILVDIENSCPERIVSLGAFTGKLQSGTGQLQTFREDRRNNAKIVKPLNYGTFCSFAPIYDSRFANLNKEESELILQTYGKCFFFVAKFKHKFYSIFNFLLSTNFIQAMNQTLNMQLVFSNLQKTANTVTHWRIVFWISLQTVNIEKHWQH